MATRSSICRFDAGSFRIDSVTGALHARVQPTKAGIFLYRDEVTGKIRRELRSRAEVFKADSLRTLEGKPFTDGHPVEDGRRILLDSGNVDQFQTGMVVGEHRVAADNLHTEARVVVTDKAHIQKIQAGKHAVSCGYRCDEDLTPGVDPEFGPYDLAQINMDYNHLANEFKGRAGDGATLKTDGDETEPHARFDAEEIDPESVDPESVDPESVDPDPDPPPPIKTDSKPKETPRRMAKIKIDHREFEVDDAAEIAISTKLKADEAAITAATQQTTAEKTRADEEKARADRLDAELATTKKELEQAKKLDVAALIRERTALETKASAILGKDVKLDSLSDRAVKETVIKKVFDWAEEEKPLAQRSDEYVDTMYVTASKSTPAPAADPGAAYGSAKPRVDASDWDNQFDLADV